MTNSNQKLQYAFGVFLQECESNKLSPTMFNFGVHEEHLEIYVAEEHDTGYLVGSMGINAEVVGEIKPFIRSVKKQLEYKLSKLEEI